MAGVVVSHPTLLRKKYNYPMRVLVAIDQLGNALTGGDEDETISSRLGKRKLSRGGVLTWRDWNGLAKPLDAVLEWISPGHSLGAIEPDVGEPPQPPRTGDTF